MVINWRRTSRFGLSWTTIAVTLAAAGAAFAQDKPTFYVIAPSLTDPFWITQQNGAKQAGEDFDVNVVFQAPAQDTGDAGDRTEAAHRIRVRRRDRPRRRRGGAVGDPAAPQR